jgi:hypothetical protein
MLPAALGAANSCLRRRGSLAGGVGLAAGASAALGGRLAADGVSSC